MRTPPREPGEEMGIPRSTIHQQERPWSWPRQIWPRRRAGRVRERQVRYGARPDEDPVSHVLGALRNLSHVPAAQKPQAMRALARAHRDLCAALGIRCPAWVQLLDEMAEGESCAPPARHESTYRVPGRGGR